MTRDVYIPLKFDRGFPHAKVPPPSKRRLAIAERVVRKEAESLLPGFQRDRSAAARIARQAAETERWWQGIRDDMAATWRMVRRILRRLPPAERTAYAHRWNNSYGPKDPAYAMDLLRHMGHDCSEGGAE